MDVISPAALEAMSEEEAQQTLTRMQADLDRKLAKAQKQWTYNVKLAQDRLGHAIKELDRLEGVMAELEPYKDTAGGQPHYERVRLLYHVFEATRDMMLVQLADNRFNLAQLHGGGLTPESVFRIPDEQVGYLRARARLDLALALFHWMVNLEGIDMVLRVTVGQPAVTCKTPKAEAPFKQRAETLKAAIATDRNLAQLVAQLGTELEEAGALIDWAKATLVRIKQLPDAAKRSALADAEWPKLNGKVAFLSGLAEKARTQPALAPHFARPEPSPLPYQEVVWSEGTGRLSGTAPLPGTGRLSGGPPRA
jgi:hypothetical protein